MQEARCGGLLLAVGTEAGCHSPDSPRDRSAQDCHQNGSEHPGPVDLRSLLAPYNSLLRGGCGAAVELVIPPGPGSGERIDCGPQFPQSIVSRRKILEN